jgi:hypothetical protein
MVDHRGRKGIWKIMKSKIEYTKGEISKVKIINDFLPPLSELVLRDENVK